ncbi:MAG TPA: flavin reductase family protein [Pilimelia sp.]|nr:flavin reductase family protein [Pilimelia sp.]
MDLDPATLDSARAYRLLTSAVVPRPIAWVSTLDADGRPNLAPFSYFAPVCSAPMTLLFCPVPGPPDRPKKDTLRNIEAVPEFVVNVAEHRNIEAVNRSSAAVPPGESEFDLTGVTPVPSRRVRPPRVREAGVAFECRLLQVVRVDGPEPSHQGGDGAAPGGWVVLGRVVSVTVADDLLADDSFSVRLDRLQPVARLGGTDYLRATDVVSLPRPR